MELRSGSPSGPIETAWDRHRFELRLVNPANRRRYHILVVGSGLAGASAAASLAEMGYRVSCFCFQDSPRRAHVSNCSIETVRNARELERKQASAASASTAPISLVNVSTRRESSTVSRRSMSAPSSRKNPGLLRTNATRLAFPCAATTHSNAIHSSKISGARRRISPPESRTCNAAPPPRCSRSSSRWCGAAPCSSGWTRCAIIGWS